MQTGKSVKNFPIVVYGTEFWNQVVNFDALEEWGVISPEDLDLFTFADDVDTAFKVITEGLERNNHGKGARKKK